MPNTVLGDLSKLVINGNEMNIKDATLTETVEEIIYAIQQNNQDISDRINDLNDRAFDNIIKISSNNESEISAINDGLYKIQYVTVTGEGEQQAETLNNSAILIQQGTHQYLYKDGKLSNREKTNNTWGNWITFEGGVTSVNGQTGAVNLSIPTKTSDITNDSGFITDAGVTSFNGQTGAVTYTAPVTSVNGQTGTVTIDTGVTSFNGQTGAVTYTAPVTSVNGQTGAVTIDLTGKADKSAAIGSLRLSINSTDYKVTLSGTKVDGTAFTCEDIIDLPLETMVVSGAYDDTTQKIILTLKNGTTTDFPVSALIDGLQSEITSTNKLSADLISDGNTNKVVTQSEKDTWNNKVDKVTSTDNAVVRFDGVSGVVQNSGVTIDDDNNISTTGNATVKNLIIQGSVTSNSDRYWSSDTASRMFAKVGGITTPIVITPTSVRRGADADSRNVNLGEGGFPWNAVYAKSFVTYDGQSTQFVKGNGTLDSTQYAPLDSPAFIGTPTAPTAPTGTNTTQIATTAFVQDVVSNMIAGGSGNITIGFNPYNTPWLFYDANGNNISESDVANILRNNHPRNILFENDGWPYYYVDYNAWRSPLSVNDNEIIITINENNGSLVCTLQSTGAVTQNVSATITGTIASPTFSLNPFFITNSLTDTGHDVVLNANITPLSMTNVQIPVYPYTYQESGSDYTGYRGLIQKSNYEIAVDIKQSASTVTIIDLQNGDADEVIAEALIDLNDRLEVVEGISAGDENIIEAVKVNGTALVPDANKAIDISVPVDLADLIDDATHRLVTDTEKSTWNNKVTSVNGQTGAVTIDTGVASFNGQTGAVTYTAPVTSVNGQTGAVTLTLGQTNVIETVKVNNTPLTPDNKAVNIDLSEYDKAPLIIEINSTDTTVPSGTYTNIGNALANGREVYIKMNGSYNSVFYLKLVGDFSKGRLLCYDFSSDNISVSIWNNNTLSIDTDIYAENGHRHGAINNEGTLNDSQEISIANGDRIVITDASNNEKIQKTSITFDGSTTTTALTPKGTWETFLKTAPVQSVNGQTGTVTIDTGVTSFNGQTGAVTYTAPVTSVNGQTGAVTIDTGVTSFNGSTGAVTYTAPVTSVNGQTGSVSLALGDTNLIETVKVNNSALTPVNKAVNITVPTKVSDLTNDSNFTSNTGTITSIIMNNVTKGTNGAVDLGTVITEHQDISGKVDKVTGMGLSSNDYTTAEKNKLAGINIGDLSSLTNTELNSIFGS